MLSKYLKLHIFWISVFVTLVSAFPSQHKSKPGAEVKGLGIPISNGDVNFQDVIANRYIVVYAKNATTDAVQAHQASIRTALKKRSLSARSVDGRTLSPMVHSLSIQGFNAMCLDAEDAMIIDISNAPEVAYIESDTRVQTQMLVRQTSATTGLARVSHAGKGGSGYVFDNNTAGTGVVVYVVDTGIMTNHSEFEGRATMGANFINSTPFDENGHGSHVSGTIAGASFGVAKNAEIVGVKVLDAKGSGSNAGLLQGLDFVAQNVTARQLSGKAVMNLSVGGPQSSAVNSAIQALTKAGVTAVVAAGNENQDAGNTSPASAPSAITVGAIDASTDIKASFSNYGKSVDIFAPGVKIQSVGIKSTNSTAELSGTSMAAPHVAGLAAYLIAAENLTTPAALVDRIKELAGSTGAAVSGANTETTTLIAYNGSGL